MRKGTSNDLYGSYQNGVPETGPTRETYFSKGRYVGVLGVKEIENNNLHCRSNSDETGEGILNIGGWVKTSGYGTKGG